MRFIGVQFKKDGDIILIMAGTLFDEKDDVIHRGMHYIDKLMERARTINEHNTH